MMRFIYYTFFFLLLLLLILNNNDGLIIKLHFFPPPPTQLCGWSKQAPSPSALVEDVPILPQMASKYGMPVDVSEVSQKQEDPPRRVCGYNLTPVPDERKLSSSNPKLGFVLYVKNQVKKKGKIVKKNNVIGIEDIGDGTESGDEGNFFFLTSAWMEGGRWVDEDRNKDYL